MLVADDAPLKCPLKRHAVMASAVVHPVPAATAVGAELTTHDSQQESNEVAVEPPTQQHRAFGRELNHANTPAKSSRRTDVDGRRAAAAQQATVGRSNVPLQCEKRESVEVPVAGRADAAVDDQNDGVTTYTRTVGPDGVVTVTASHGREERSPIERRRATTLALRATRAVMTAHVAMARAAAAGNMRQPGASRRHGVGRGGVATSTEASSTEVRQRRVISPAEAGKPASPLVASSWTWGGALTNIAIIAACGGAGVALAYTLLHVRRSGAAEAASTVHAAR